MVPTGVFSFGSAAVFGQSGFNHLVGLDDYGLVAVGQLQQGRADASNVRPALEADDLFNDGMPPFFCVNLIPQIRV